MSKDIKTSGGIGFLGWLGLLFIALKLLKVITWPWVWVLCPIWGGVALVFILFVIILLIAMAKNK